MTEFIEILADNGDKRELIMGLNEVKIIIVLVTSFKILLIFKNLICFLRAIW